jgi:hypothetical protein
MPWPTGASVESIEQPWYKALPGLIVIDKSRWRADIVEYWRKDEPERFNSIRAARAKVIS